jgi:hypothetical protein
MTKEKAESLFRDLENLHGSYQVPAEVRETLIEVFCADRIILDLARNEARLRLERPLADGTETLKARGLSHAEMKYVRRFRKGEDRQVIPWKSMRWHISVQNGIGMQALEALTENDLQLLTLLAAFFAE